MRMHAVCSVLSICILCAHPAPAAGPAPGQQCLVVGKLQPVTLSEVLPAIKEFRIQFTVLRANPDEGWQVAWLVEELTGRPRWYWHQRFGILRLLRDATATVQDGPTILAEHRGAVRALSLPPPYLLGPALEPGTRFEMGRLVYTVERKEKVNGRAVVRIAGHTQLAQRETLWVDPESRLVIKRQRRVFLGQGVPHRLTLELARTRQVSEAQLQQLRELFDQLEDLRGDQPYDPTRPSPPVVNPATQDALSTLAAALAVRGKALEAELRLLTAAVREMKEAEARQQQVAKLTRAAVGRPAPELELTDLAGQTLRLSDFKGKIVVLHFWQYGGERIEAPYGEVGYLDFLHRKLKDKPVAVLGVAVHPGLLQAATRSRAAREVGNFVRFMNLSYPVLLDTERAIERFGDPRRSKARLPLYVVVDRAGKVASYHVGPWSNSPDTGLAELAEIIEELLEE